MEVPSGNDLQCHVDLKDDLVALEECMPIHSNDDINRAIFRLQKSLLSHHPLYLQISKNEFAALLLKAFGPDKLTSSAVNDLFEEIDIDNDGFLSVEELARYLIRTESKNTVGMCHFYYSRMMRPSILRTCVFLSASLLSIAKNLFTRFHYQEHVFTAVVAQFKIYLPLISNFLFIWSAFKSIRIRLRDIRSSEYRSASAKVRMLVADLPNISQVNKTFWVLGNVSFVSGLMLSGGICYLVGGVLAFPALYKSALAEQIDNDELLCRLRASISELDLVGEDLGSTVVTRRSSIVLDDSSTDSDMTNTVYEMKFGKSDRQIMSYDGLHKRLCSDSNAMFVIKELNIKERRAVKATHKRAPTCPPDLFKRTSLATCETESITDTECSVPASDWASLLGEDITVNVKLKSRIQVQCHEAFLSCSKNQSNPEASFRTIKRMSNSNVVDIRSIQEKPVKDFKQKAFLQLIFTPLFYVSVAFTLGGLMFTIGACLRFSLPVTQNIYLTGSSMYLFGCIGILYRTWIGTRDEWNLLQEIRKVLRTMAYLDSADEDLEVGHRL